MDGAGPANPIRPQRKRRTGAKNFFDWREEWAEPKGKKVCSDGFAKGPVTAIGHRQKQGINTARLRRKGDLGWLTTRTGLR